MIRILLQIGKSKVGRHDRKQIMKVVGGDSQHTKTPCVQLTYSVQLCSITVANVKNTIINLLEAVRRVLFGPAAIMIMTPIRVKRHFQSTQVSNGCRQKNIVLFHMKNV